MFYFSTCVFSRFLDCIVLSSDNDEDELNNDNVLSALPPTTILPIYLLNHL